MTIFEALTAIKNSNVACKPFDNYDNANITEVADNGTRFVADTECWPIHSVEYASTGNLNIKFDIPGKMIEANGTEHRCKQMKTITIVKNGELKQQFLMMTKDKWEQGRLTVPVKNNIVNLGQFPLTDKTAVDVKDVFNASVNKFVASLFKTAQPKPAMSPEQIRLNALGLRPDGYYNKPVTNRTVVEANTEIKVNLKGLSSKTTVAAKNLKTAMTGKQVGDYKKLNELLYNMKVLKIHADNEFTTKVGDIEVKGSVKA